MFTFIPQLLIILSLAGIILIVLRRTPELKFPIPVHLKNAENFAIKWLKLGAHKLWHFILEVKELTKKSEALSYLPRHLPKLHFPSRAHLHFPSFPGLFQHGTAEFFVREGKLAIEAGDQARAEQSFINAVKKDPGSESAFAMLGRLYLAQNKTKEAVETFKYLIKHHPERAQYSASLGEAYYNQHKHDKAIAAFERAVELEPANPKHFLSLGRTLEDKNHLEEAILNYRRVVELDGSDTQGILKLCEALIKKGDKTEAELMLEKLLLQEPTNHIAREKLMSLKY